jgi:hypothetical protein
MAKRKTPKRRQRHDPCIPDRTPLHVRASHSAGLPHAVPIALPTYWTPEQAIAVFELADDLRETIWSIYQTNLQDLTRQQRQSPVIGRFETSKPPALLGVIGCFATGLGSTRVVRFCRPVYHPPRRPSISRLSFSSAARASAARR